MTPREYMSMPLAEAMKLKMSREERKKLAAGCSAISDQEDARFLDLCGEAWKEHQAGMQKDLLKLSQMSVDLRRDNDPLNRFIGCILTFGLNAVLNRINQIEFGQEDKTDEC